MFSTNSNIVNFFSKHRNGILVFFVAILFTTTSFFSSSLRFASDDQFIHYRYIDNLAYGNGFVYNIGEKILGSSSPLFSLVSASVKIIFSNVYTPDLIAYINIIILSLSAVFLYQLGQKFISAKWVWLLTFIYILNSGRMIPQGMETPLFLLLFFIFINLLLEQKFKWSAVVLSLLILTRPDAGLIAVLCFIYWAQHKSFKEALKYTMITVLVALPWLIFATIYFGSPVPQSVIAKSHVNDIINQSSIQAVSVQLSSISRIYWGNIFNPDNRGLQVIFNLLPILLLVLYAIKEKINRENWIIAVTPVIYFMLWSITNPVMFPWYTSQLEPIWLILSFIGVFTLVEKIKKTWLHVIIIIIILMGPVVRWYNLATTNDQGSKVGNFQTSEILKKIIKNGDRIMINNYGVIGYVTNAYILDPFGLINNDTLRFYPISPECNKKGQMFVYPAIMIEEFKPEIIVATREEISDCFSEDNWFEKNYSQANIDNLSFNNIWLLNK